MSPIDALFVIFQVLLGSASIYSLLDNAISIGLFLMFMLYLITFIQMIAKNAIRKSKSIKT